MITAEKKKKNKFLPNFEKQSIYSLRYDEMQDWLVQMVSKNSERNKFLSGFENASMTL